LRERIHEVTAGLDGNSRILVMGCEYGVELDGLEHPATAWLRLPCTGALPPSFLDYVLSRNYADGVLLTGCHGGDCHERFGIEWTEQRLDGSRDPRLRKRVPRERIVTCWAGSDGKGKLLKELKEFSTRLAALEPYEQRAVEGSAADEMTG